MLLLLRWRRFLQKGAGPPPTLAHKYHGQRVCVYTHIAAIVEAMGAAGRGPLTEELLQEAVATRRMIEVRRRVAARRRAAERFAGSPPRAEQTSAPVSPASWAFSPTRALL